VDEGVKIVFALGFALLASGCAGIAPVQRPPPAAPRRVEPTVTLPAAPPPPGKARVVLDAEGDQATVWRVAEPEERLCITPCSVDLLHGAHTLVFASPRRWSSTQVVVPAGASTTYVTHAIGNEGFASPAYVGGGALFAFGIGLAVLGTLVTGLGAFGQPAMQEDGTMSNPDALILPGTIALGTGVLMIGGGAVMMSKNRPVQQHGSTTTWRKE
jgi:hypothetical protein